MTRVVAHFGELYSTPRRAQKRRRCDGHLAPVHWINPGDLVMVSALPPGDPEIGNDHWLHAWFCAHCWPEVTP